ncbi:3'-phosphoadenosine 5'-phosphosulfate sulfotransferase [Exophiala xenobiotica]|nr:3'-phosphoadenosine 5'-phosphosulfate sulfotransferase [Exophiala xenobiotica]KAK5224747.1 3'-phosphoadenosine 5'-phosphosulfate sulfotransferase [Exophiala xenobiotica]KAK5254703.1 3'-phosphoadenosine 5'-phosphosulfate sulfotransferase [Exophiala xenobiotica]KAK5293830.1 3'-phosphoadenosine 5'-phosphosulfate sulfotransferase [Exophiala xenobiotica]KAK5354744.1 3'-phosphoadenosine 5'-phosphosulfate sulfotransferase [Exophiala xenobiotica]
MSNASLPPNAPMMNGTVPDRHGEADVSSSSSLEHVCAQLHSQVQSFLAASPSDDVTRRTQEQTKIALGVIEQALGDYEFEALSLSYNGGKDCLVLLILYLAVLHTHFSRLVKTESNRQDGSPTFTSFPTSIPSIYAKPPDPFPAVSDFVEYSARLYHLELAHISTNPGPSKKERSHSNPTLTPKAYPRVEQPNPNMNPNDGDGDGVVDSVDHSISISKPIVSFRDAFELYLSSHPSVKAIFVGTRRTDPHGAHLTHFDPTDHNWPPFMRIHPVIDWHLSEIWCFLRSPHLKDLETGGPLRYCPMYDEGYTSLGGVNDTLKNPKLKARDEDGREYYRPAYEMTEDEGERLGRD